MFCSCGRCRIFQNYTLYFSITLQVYNLTKFTKFISILSLVISLLNIVQWDGVLCGIFWCNVVMWWVVWCYLVRFSLVLWVNLLWYSVWCCSIMCGVVICCCIVCDVVICCSIVCGVWRQKQISDYWLWTRLPKRRELRFDVKNRMI